MTFRKVKRARFAVPVALGLALLCMSGLAQEEMEVALTSDTDYALLASRVSAEQISDTVRQMAALGSRVTGYPGSEQAAAWVERRFRELGLEDVATEDFPAMAPVPSDPQRPATLQVADREFVVYPLWPNLVRTPQTPPGGLVGPLVDGGEGRFRDYNERQVAGAIVLMDFNSGLHWLNAAMVGARAVLFVEPEVTIRGEAEQKFLSLPADIPRYWVPRATADYLKGLLKVEPQVRVALHCDMAWREVSGRNIIGVLPGSDPRLNKQRVVVQAYYDSMSVVPSLAPGAEAAASLAALFQTIQAFQAQPPKRTVVFLATGGHFTGLAGTKHFLGSRLRGGRNEAHVRYCFNLANQSRRDIEEIMDRLWGEEIGPGGQRLERTTAEQLRGLSGLAGRVRTAAKRTHRIERRAARGLNRDPNAGKLPMFHLSDEELERRNEYLQAFIEGMDEVRQRAGEVEVAIRQARDTAAADEASQRAALAAVQETVYALTDALDFAEDDVDLWFSIDLSSHHQAFGIFFKGYFYNYSEGIQWKFADIGKKAREYAALIGPALSVDPATRFVDAINALQGKNWQAWMGGQLGLESEVATLAGIPGLGLATVNDSRAWVDTPMDVPENMNLDNITEQTRFLVCLLADMVSTNQPRDLYRLDLNDDFVEVRGRAVEFDPAVSTFPDRPVPDALAAVRRPQKSVGGIRTELIDRSDEDGYFTLVGLPNVRAVGGPTTVEAFLTDRDDGSILMAPDRGVNGAEAYPIEVPMDQALKPATVVLFRCKSMAIFDMVDQRYFDLLQQIYVYDAAMEAEPYAFGYSLPLQPASQTSAYEPVALVYAMPGTRLRITMAANLLGLRFLLLNNTPENPYGSGYLIDENPVLAMTPYLVARDMWALDTHRIELLRRYGITNNLVDEAHADAATQLEAAMSYLREHQYDKFISAARSAWSLESRAYPAVRATADDVIKGIIFYMALLLPFSFFVERLLIGHPDLKWQLLGTAGIFLAIFAVLYFVHPAFALAATSIVILLAFIILALGLLVTSIIVRKFEDEMKEVRYEQTGVHAADVGRLSASAAAFSLGVSNMRRRKVRTLLTCLTLILLTFTVMSFTSVVSTVRANKILIPKLANYNGMMIRDRNWQPIGDMTYKQMETEFAARYHVAGRAWYFSAEPGKQSFVTISRGPRTYSATAMLGVMADEAEMTRPQQYLVEGSRWFQEGDKLACILPEGMATELGVQPEDIGLTNVNVFGNEMRVIGILSSSRFRSAQDLDGESLTPVDFMIMQQMLQQQQQQQQQRGRGRGAGAEMQEYIHLQPDTTILVPYSFVMDHGGTLRSVAIATPDAATANEVLDQLITRIELNLYAGIGGRTYLCSAIGATSFGGLGDLIIPILIAAAIVLNTMLGSVYERVREIYIYSSLGLAPNHVAALFIAEASVYAVLGAIAGYLVGQTAAKVVTTFDLSAGLNLNYSSLSAVATTLVIMATVLASVMYPARRASDIAMPGIERRWSLPEPEGDLLQMELPFTVTGDQALGVNMYLHEFFTAHTDYSLGQFSTGDIVMTEEEYDLGPGYALSAMVWLAPYDLGVSERFVLQTVPTEDPEIFRIQARIIRQSGDDASWMRVTRNFVNIIRKQYLLWRTFPAAQKDDYGHRAQRLLAGELVEELAGEGT